MHPTLPFFPRLLAALLLLVLCSTSEAQTTPTESFQLVTNATLPVANLSSTCADALMEDIACNSYARRFRPGQYYDPRALLEVCTTDCQASIQQYIATVEAACTGADNGGGDAVSETVLYNYTETTYLPVSALGTRLLYNYELVCLQNSQGIFCNYLAYEGSLQLDANASAYLGPANSTTSISMCDECFARQLQLEAGSPFDGGDNIASEYASFTSSCSITGMPITTTSLATSTLSLTAAPAPTCTGSTYAVQAGDTCESIAEAQDTSVGWLVYDNNLNAYCANFSAATTASLCVQNTCTTHIVQAGDNCTALATANNVTVTQLISWNPMLDTTCSNLALSIDQNICVGKPGRAVPTITVTSAPATSFTTQAAIPTDIATNTTTDCGLYYKVILGDYCNLVCLKFGISLDDFLFLNPDVNANCTNLFAEESYCVAPVGDLTSYPGYPGYVAPVNSATLTSAWSDAPKATYVPPVLNFTDPNPLANGTRTDCWSVVDGNDLQHAVNGTMYESTCALLADVYGVTLAELQNWNPSLDTNSSDCSFELNTQYCLQAYNGTSTGSTPGTTLTTDPIRTGTWTNCTAYLDVNFGMTCQTILDNYDLSIEDFSTWNPEVGTQCENLWEDYSYCVSLTQTLDDAGGIDTGDSAATTTITTTTTSSLSLTTTTGIAVPGPTQSGIPADCISYYVAQSTDTCYSIETAFGITDVQFHSWNPAISDDCLAGLWAGEAYCVGVAGSTATPITTATIPSTTSVAAPSPTQPNSIISSCNDFAQAVDGDYCYIFASEHGITTDELYAWNSVLGDNGADCGTDFWLGYYYCVGVSS